MSSSSRDCEELLFDTSHRRFSNSLHVPTRRANVATGHWNDQVGEPQRDLSRNPKSNSSGSTVFAGACCRTHSPRLEISGSSFEGSAVAPSLSNSLLPRGTPSPSRASTGHQPAFNASTAPAHVPPV